MKMFFFRRYDEAGMLLGQVRRPLFQSELSVQLIAATNAMLPDTRLIIDGLFIGGTMNGTTDFKAAAASLAPGDLDTIWYRADRETFHKVVVDGTSTNGYGFADYTPVAPVIAAPVDGGGGGGGGGTPEFVGFRVTITDASGFAPISVMYKPSDGVQTAMVQNPPDSQIWELATNAPSVGGIITIASFHNVAHCNVVFGAFNGSGVYPIAVSLLNDGTSTVNGNPNGDYVPGSTPTVYDAKLTVINNNPGFEFIGVGMQSNPGGTGSLPLTNLGGGVWAREANTVPVFADYQLTVSPSGGGLIYTNPGFTPQTPQSIVTLTMNADGTYDFSGGQVKHGSL